MGQVVIVAAKGFDSQLRGTGFNPHTSATSPVDVLQPEVSFVYELTKLVKQ